MIDNLAEGSIEHRMLLVAPDLLLFGRLFANGS